MKNRVWKTVVLSVMLMTMVTSAFALQVTTPKGSLNLRRSASKTATIILYIRNGTTVIDKSEINAPQNGFTYISAKGYLSGEKPGERHMKVGWAMSKFLK